MMLDFFSECVRLSKVEIFLNTSNIDADAIEAWKHFIDNAVSAVGLSYSFDFFESPPSASDSFFAFISDSASLTRKLLCNVPRIYIYPLRAPGKIDPFFYWKDREAYSESSRNIHPHEHEVTIITSVFSGNNFLSGFLQNCETFINYDSYEHFLIRAASPDDEHSLLLEHVLRHPSVIYLNLIEDPGLYEVWNLGICLASGRYLTNANIDDRRSPDHIVQLVDILQKKPNVAVAATGLYISTTPNLDWPEAFDCPRMFIGVASGTYSADILFKQHGSKLASRNLPHCMPVWRRRLHATMGFFDEKRYGPSADWAFWLRCAANGNAIYYDSHPRGVYLRHRTSYWHRADTSVYEKKICAEFGYLLHSSQKVLSFDAQVLPLSAKLGAAIKLFRFGISLEGLAFLAGAIAQRLEIGKAEENLINYISERYLFVNDWKHWKYVYKYFQLVQKDPICGVFAICINICHDFILFKKQKINPGYQRFLNFICFDFYECYDRQSGLLLFYFVSRIFQDRRFEKELLTTAYNYDKNKFWKIFPSVDLFSLHIFDVLMMLSLYGRFHLQDFRGKKINIVCYPNYTGNAYQQLLYSSLTQFDVKITKTSDSEGFFSAIPINDGINILHLHWIDKLFSKNETKSSYRVRASKVINFLLSQKKRGFKIFWTIHNYQGHDCNYPTLEREFRKSLYDIVDIAFVHHPLAAELLDWLPDQKKLQICEHGRYPEVAKSLGRNEARSQLGLHEKDFVVAYIGRVRKYKALLEILPIMVEVLQNISHMKLIIVGLCDSHDAEVLSEKYFHPRLIVKNMRLTNFELESYMKAADIGLLSYSAILTSGSLIHWLSCGRPVIAPSLGTIPAYVVDAWNGFLYENGEQLKNILRYCSSLPQPFFEKICSNAKKTAEALDWSFL